MNRRVLLLSSLACLVASASACKREERCRTCGMKIDGASAWRTELLGAGGAVVGVFDAPRCAFAAWRGGEVPAEQLRVPEYYSRTPRTGAPGELRFVIGGDVVGPMGPDLVPVAPELVTKFIQDHGAERAFTVDEVTLGVLAALR